ncbi:Ubiquinone biosynthesis O-methyltransferase [Drechslerella dactyloides]|uniref:Ubiquinone biosynthesis O-methyltransferase, mitochondrial n=1 Tax=Drechslerella dactyloides TaxID=74499 RepID=A0AAD6NIP0_DREDA|nr:Ubiquinone biosynthesis O-methyltransferase [Drechslerella dactyloides]
MLRRSLRIGAPLLHSLEPVQRAPRLSPSNIDRAIQKFSSQNARCISTSAYRRKAEAGNSTTGSRGAVDPDELSHFNALASTWWDAQGPSRLLHLMNPMRINFAKHCLQMHPTSATADAGGGESPFSKGLRVLDVGCGGGIFSESIARLPETSHVVGLDPSEQILAVARAHAKKDPTLTGKLQYINSTIDDYPSDHQVDLLTLFEVVEHVPYPAAFLQSCMRHVRPGGWIVLSTIARTWSSWFTTKLVAEDLLRIVPRGTHDWHKYINENEMRAFFEKQPGWGAQGMLSMGCLYVPGFGWKAVKGSEHIGNYFFGVRRDMQ